MRAKREIVVNTIIVHSGWTIAQATPSTVCLYRTRMSRSAMHPEQLAVLPDRRQVRQAPASLGAHQHAP